MKYCRRRTHRRALVLGNPFYATLNLRAFPRSDRRVTGYSLGEIILDNDYKSGTGFCKPRCSIKRLEIIASILGVVVTFHSRAERAVVLPSF